MAASLRKELEKRLKELDKGENNATTHNAEGILALSGNNNFNNMNMTNLIQNAIMPEKNEQDNFSLNTSNKNYTEKFNLFTL